MNAPSERVVSASFVNDLVVTVRGVVDAEGNRSTIVRIAPRGGGGTFATLSTSVGTAYADVMDGSPITLKLEAKRDST